MLQSAANVAGTARRKAAITGDPPVDAVRAQLERILASEVFSRSARLSGFLRFVVETKFGGGGDLKQYTIGAQVYGRGAAFDPTTDTIVRVEARRLRATLRRFYEDGGRSDLVLIEVPKGGYEPVFRWRAPSPAAPLDAAPCSVAVLPFENLGPDDRQNDLAAGIADEIINALAQVEGLRVAARTSTFAFRGCYQDIRSIGEALNVGVVVEGSVRGEGNRARVTAQIINIRDGYHFWSQRFDREGESAFAIQDEIAAAVTDQVRRLFAQRASDEASHAATRTSGVGGEPREDVSAASGNKAMVQQPRVPDGVAESTARVRNELLPRLYRVERCRRSNLMAGRQRISKSS